MHPQRVAPPQDEGRAQPCYSQNRQVHLRLLYLAREGAMKRTTVAMLVAAVIAAGTMSVPTTADARCYGCGVGAGFLAGAIIGGAIANSQPRYYGPAPTYYYEGPPPRDAVEYCMDRYKSYDPRSGTYLGYDGFRHPCP